jgi:DNA-binding NarL/FixJ family response regulator
MGIESGEARIRVGVVDEYPSQVAGVVGAIDDSSTMRVSATAASGEQALTIMAANPPDVVLVEPWMRTGDGLAFITKLHQQHPTVAMVAYSRMWDDDHVAEARAAGAAAHIPKTTPVEDLPAILRQILAGAEVRPSGHAAVGAAGDLTTREREVLLLASRGMSNAEIADMLFVTEQTVKFHLSNIYRKLGVHNRTQASHRAARAGMLG